MKNITFETLNNVLSESRVLPYKKICKSPNETLEKYHENVKLGISLLPSFHYLEICLRNHIDQALRELFSDNWLLIPIEKLKISDQDLKKIQKIKSSVLKIRGTEATQDDVVSQMSFGFWCSFLQKKYDPIIWQRKNVFKSVFPNIERSQRTRKYVEPKILEIKKIRNRIAHHEPIWKNSMSIDEVHSMCCFLISAMSRDAMEMLKEIDNFAKTTL